MSHRGTKDESFIGMAFEDIIGKHDISNQDFYNGYKEDEIPIVQLAVFITAVKIYNHQGILTDQDLEKAKEAKTYGQVRDLIDEFQPKWLAANKK